VAVFGIGGGTSSYLELEDTDVILLWGSNARDAHPIFFHHVLKGVRRGAKLYAIDPRRTSSAQWADLWLGLDVGSDIALANAIAREILACGLENRSFIENATTGFEAYCESVQPYTLDRAEELTSVPRESIRELAHAYARADRAQLCWTLGITEHHNATDNVLALINLALLTGHVGRWGSGVVPIRGQNNVQGGGDMGALPNRLPGFHELSSEESRAQFEKAWKASIPPEPGLHISLMLEAMEHGDLRSLYVIGENPAQSEADAKRTCELLEGLDHLVIQDIFRTRTAEMAHVVLPAAASWAECEGTVTSSERRVQRVRKALEPPGEAKDDIDILCALARRLGHDWPTPSAREVWDELRSLSPAHYGMTYERLDKLGGLQWPCFDEDDPGSPFLHGRLWKRPVEGRKAPFHVVEHEPPVDALDQDFPIRLTTGRRLDSFNTGVQTSGFASPIRDGETLDLSPLDARRLGLAAGERVRVVSRRGSVEAPVRYDENLRPGLAFMTLHFPDEVDVNQLTIEAWDPKSGTSEFKATAIRIEKLTGEGARRAPVLERAGVGPRAH
jgi:formate dehydrogenase major subunit